MKTFVAGAALALAVFASVAGAEDKVIKVGALKLIHSITPYFYDKFAPAGYKIEVIPFESPTDGKNAVLTGSVDFGTFGIAAAMLGIAAGEPLVIFAAQCNRGMAGWAGAKSHINPFQRLKGNRVSIWPAPPQEVVLLHPFKAQRTPHNELPSVAPPLTTRYPSPAP